MNISDIRTIQLATKAGAHRREHSLGGHARLWPRTMSRRQFGRAAASAAVIGGALGSGFWKPALADPRNDDETTSRSTCWAGSGSSSGAGWRPG
jgi:hypothetical protein